MSQLGVSSSKEHTPGRATCPIHARVRLQPMLGFGLAVLQELTHFKPTKSLGPEHHEAHSMKGHDTCKMLEPLLPAQHGQSNRMSRLTIQHEVMVAQCDDGYAKVTSGSHHFVIV
jgi:hypothetical protein